MTDTIAIPASPAPSLSASWIKACAIGSLSITAAPMAVFGLSKAISAPSLSTSSPSLIVFYAITVILVTLSYIHFGNLTADVLAQKLPGFRRAAWVAFYTMLGLIVAVASAYLYSTHEVPWEDDWGLLIFTVIGVIALGAAVGAALGGLQALTLRHAARNLKPWIGYSALACTLIVIPALVEPFGPAGGLAKELMAQAAAFVATIGGSVIMLPALHRLAAR